MNIVDVIVLMYFFMTAFIAVGMTCGENYKWYDRCIAACVGWMLVPVALGKLIQKYI